MEFTTLGQLEENCTIMLNVKPSNNWRYTAQTSDTWTNKPLPKSILVSILANFPVFSQLYLSERRHFVREHCLRRLPLSGPLIVPIRGRDDIPLLSGQSGGTFSLSLCYERVVLPQLQSTPDDIYFFFCERNGCCIFVVKHGTSPDQMLFWPKTCWPEEGIKIAKQYLV